MEFGEVKLPVVMKPKLRSVAEAVTPSAQFMTPPDDPLITAPAPVLP